MEVKAHQGVQDSPPQRWERGADSGGDSWRTGPETQVCLNPAAAGRWRTGSDCSLIQ